MSSGTKIFSRYLYFDPTMGVVGLAGLYYNRENIRR